MNRQIWQEPSEPALHIKSLLRAGTSIELLGADKTEIEPGGILATGLIGIRFVDSFISVCFRFCSGNGEKDGKDNWNEN